MASVVPGCPRRHPDDAEDLLPHHGVEVVSALVRERRGRHDRAHDGPVVVATDGREDKSRTAACTDGTTTRTLTKTNAKMPASLCDILSPKRGASGPAIPICQNSTRGLPYSLPGAQSHETKTVGISRWGSSLRQALPARTSFRRLSVDPIEEVEPENFDGAFGGFRGGNARRGIRTLPDDCLGPGQG